MFFGTPEPPNLPVRATARDDRAGGDEDGCVRPVKSKQMFAYGRGESILRWSPSDLQR
jgi:hypothetical protein